MSSEAQRATQSALGHPAGLAEVKGLFLPSHTGELLFTSPWVCALLWALVYPSVN